MVGLKSVDLPSGGVALGGFATKGPTLHGLNVFQLFSVKHILDTSKTVHPFV